MMTREDILKSDGWTKQSTHDEPRLSEVINMYQEIGLEVFLEPFNPSEESGCRACIRATAQNYKTVFTRNISRMP